MALIEFKDLPDTSTPLNAENLNNNFNEVKHQDIITNGNAVKCGYKLDEKDVYVKRVNIGNLPNNSTNTVDVGLNPANINVLFINGVTVRSSDGEALPLPFCWGQSSSTESNFIGIVFSPNGLMVRCNTDRSEYTGYINIYFTYKN